ncbi:MAG TPA: DUF742 domain-containing protein [Pseudonocardiaceae bacterium]|jgi:hypothetical protein|nr:DUF742 domain-containing protein [Pseudonocardiaceae bacterium]
MNTAGPVNKWVAARIRPYTLTGGRTRTRHELLVETIISVPHYDPSLRDGLMPESRELYELARTKVSIAELSALLTIPLAVVRVLVSDLADYGAIMIHPTGHTYRHDKDTLERILDGLNQLSI